jgi:hypothetical protein
MFHTRSTPCTLTVKTAVQHRIELIYVFKARRSPYKADPQQFVDSPEQIGINRPHPGFLVENDIGNRQAGRPNPSVVLTITGIGVEELKVR